MEMTQQRLATSQSSSEWEPIFHSYRPLQIRYAPGEMICQAGSYLAGIHLIVRGVVSDMVLSARGELRGCDVLGPGDLIGLELLGSNSNELSISLCRAVTAVELLFVERAQLESALDDNPALQRAFLRHIVARFVVSRKDPREQASAETQLCRLLLRLGESCGHPTDDGRIALPSEIALRTLGELLCISSRQLRHARRALQSLGIGESGIDFDPDEARRLLDDECPSTA